MTLFELLLVAIGLSMDAFAVSVCKGLEMKQVTLKKMTLIAGLFGVFQAIMPLLGWLIGIQFSRMIQAYDHWIAFILLTLIGVKMIYEAIKDNHDEACPIDDRLDIKELLVLAVATSIDALAVGVTLAFLDVNIVHSVGFIGTITVIICGIGVYLGHRFGGWFNDKAEIIGGLILISIGLKILIEHLQLFGW